MVQTELTEHIRLLKWNAGDFTFADVTMNLAYVVLQA
jgi:hypothetical protein